MRSRCRSNEPETSSDAQSRTSANDDAFVFALAFAFAFLALLLLLVPLFPFRAIDHADELSDDAGDAFADGLVFVVEESNPACGDEPELSVFDAAPASGLPQFPDAEGGQTELVHGDGELLALREKEDPHARERAVDDPARFGESPFWDDSLQDAAESPYRGDASREERGASNGAVDELENDDCELSLPELQLSRDQHAHDRRTRDPAAEFDRLIFESGEEVLEARDLRWVEVLAEDEAVRRAAGLAVRVTGACDDLSNVVERS